MSDGIEQEVEAEAPEGWRIVAKGRVRPSDMVRASGKWRTASSLEDDPARLTGVLRFVGAEVASLPVASVARAEETILDDWLTASGCRVMPGLVMHDDKGLLLRAADWGDARWMTAKELFGTAVRTDARRKAPRELQVRRLWLDAEDRGLYPETSVRRRAAVFKEKVLGCLKEDAGTTLPALWASVVGVPTPSKDGQVDALEELEKEGLITVRSGLLFLTEFNG